MTGTVVLSTAGLHTEGDTIDNTNGLKWINECIQMDLALDAMVADTDTIVATADSWNNLSTDVLEVYEIWKSGDSVPYFGKMYGTFYEGSFDIRNLQIRFPEAGTYTVYCYRTPDAMTELASAIPINAQFGYAISLWVARRHKFYYDEKSAGAQRLIQEYDHWKDKAIKVLSKIRPTTKAPRRARIGSWR